MKEFGFRPSERLKSRKLIKMMFSRGESFGKYPLRLVYLRLDKNALPAPVQFTVSVPKRHFKRAVHRNPIRRQVREAWRLHKSTLYERLGDHPHRFAFMVLYVAKEPRPYTEIERSMQKIIHRFCKIHDL